jgi:hypothetical protein
MRLTTAYEPPEPDVAKLKHVQFKTAAVASGRRAELTIRATGNVYAAYGLLASIADDLQIEQRPLAAAVAAAVLRQRDILTTRSSLTIEQEIGLFGELLFLEFLIGVMGPEPAIASWFGPLSEEHDFVFDDIHLEVKTTVSEQRKHVINGLAQLVPVPGVPLSLVSIQLTRAPPSSGDALPTLIARVRDAAGGHSVRLDAMLAASGWDDHDEDLYPTRWTLRSRPRAFVVDQDFPALTPKRIASTVPRFALVSDVIYRVNVASLACAPLPSPLADFVIEEIE